MASVIKAFITGRAERWADLVEIGASPLHFGLLERQLQGCD